MNANTNRQLTLDLAHFFLERLAKRRQVCVRLHADG